ncbi:hypothetical protein Tco_0214689 [Tanacetum coccineum]
MVNRAGKEEPLHVNPAETLDTIRQHAKDKVKRQQHVVISALSYKCVFDLNILEQLTWNFFNVGGNNAEASDSASRQAQQIEPVVGQDGSGGSGAGAVIGLSTAAGEGGASVASQGSSYSRWTKRRIQTERISPQKRTPTQPVSQPSTSSQLSVSETKNANEREMSDGVPTQSSATGGASEWSFLEFQKLICFRRVYVCNSSPHKWQTSKSTSMTTV